MEGGSKSLTVMMQELAAYQGLSYLNTANGRLARSKRLQRAHKFCLLVYIFGFKTLDVSPAVSVSRLDKVSWTLFDLSGAGQEGSYRPSFDSRSQTAAEPLS